MESGQGTSAALPRAWEDLPARPLRAALRAASAFPIAEDAIQRCVDLTRPGDRLFDRARKQGLKAIKPRQRSGRLSPVTGAIAESVAEILLDELGYNVFSQVITAGLHGVDLLYLAPDESVLALEVKGTLRKGAIPRMTPSVRRQMSRDWLNDARNAPMADWDLEADDLFAGVMVIDLAGPEFRVALSGNFELYVPITKLVQLSALHWLEPR